MLGTISANGGLLAAMEPEKKETLRVALSGNYLPLHGVGGDMGMIGFEADLAGLLGRNLGRPVVFVNTRKEFGLGAVEAVAAGKVDIGLNSITVTEERAKQVDFTSPYLVLRARLAGTQARPTQTPRDGERVAVSSERIAELVAGRFPKVEILRLGSDNDAVKDVVEGKAAWAAGESVSLVLTIRGSALALSSTSFGDLPLAIAVRKGGAVQTYENALQAERGNLLALARLWRVGLGPRRQWLYDYFDDELKFLPPWVDEAGDCRVTSRSVNSELHNLYVYSDGVTLERFVRGNAESQTRTNHNDRGLPLSVERRYGKEWGKARTFTYDEEGFLRSMVQNDMDETTFLFEHDSRGLVTRKTLAKCLKRGCSGELFWEYDYDKLRRLTEVKKVDTIRYEECGPGGCWDMGPHEGQHIRFTYNGERLEEIVESGAHDGSTVTTTLIYDRYDRLVAADKYDWPTADHTGPRVIDRWRTIAFERDDMGNVIRAKPKSGNHEDYSYTGEVFSYDGCEQTLNLGINLDFFMKDRHGSRISSTFPHAESVPVKTVK